MSSDPQRGPAADVDAEQEVDFGRYWRAIAARWWLPVGGLVAGLVIGYLVSLGTHSSAYKATAQVYLGQPLAPGGAAPVGSAPTSLGLVSNYVTAESTIKRVAGQVGLKPGRLRGRVTTKPITGITGAKLGTPAPLLAITVSGSAPAEGRGRRERARRSRDQAGRSLPGVQDPVAARPARLRRRAAGGDRQPASRSAGAAVAGVEGHDHQRDRQARRAREPELRDHAGAPAAEHDLARPLHRPPAALAGPGRRVRADRLPGVRDEDGRREQPHRRRDRRPDRPDHRDPRGAAVGPAHGPPHAD